MTIPPPPPGQGPVDPRGAFAPPPPPGAGAPPPMMFPPMMMPPPPYYPPPRGGFARAIFTTLATTIFGLSLAANIYLLILTGYFGNSENADQTVVVNGDPKQKIAVLTVNGIIDEGTFQVFDKMLKQIETDGNVKALVLEIDTPGGTVSASDEIYHRILTYKEEKHLPVVVAMGGFATSGGYFISCAADQIVAQRTTITGNIGVLFPSFNVAKLADRWGIEDTTIHSTGSNFKDAGSPLKQETPEEHAYWLGLIDDAFDRFKEVVKTGRGTRLTAPLDQVFNGKAYTAGDALKMGLIDKSGYQDDAYDLAASLVSPKLTNKHVVRYEPAPSLIDAITGRSQSKASMQSVNINGVNVNLDRHWIDELTTPRLMYLWRAQ